MLNFARTVRDLTYNPFHAWWSVQVTTIRAIAMLRQVDPQRIFANTASRIYSCAMCYMRKRFILSLRAFAPVVIFRAQRGKPQAGYKAVA